MKGGREAVGSDSDVVKLYAEFRSNLVGKAESNQMETELKKTTMSFF